MSLLRSFALVASVAVLAACAPDSGLQGVDDEAANDDARAVEADTVYKVTRQDFRKCISPVCGGVFVQAVNKAKTTCLDGSKQEECYVGAIDLAALELPDDQTVDVRGQATAGDVLLSGKIESYGGDFSQIGKLTAFKAFAQRTEADATGTYYVVEPSGIVCITTPCPTLRARKINSTSVKSITDLDFASLGLTDDEIAAALATINQKNLVVAGVLKTKGQQKKLVISQIFDTVQPSLALCLSDDACGADAHCDTTECLSNCAPDMVCPAVCYGACKPGPAPAPSGGTCVDACGGAAIGESCYCDDACDYYGDCCSDYVSECL